MAGVEIEGAIEAVSAAREEVRAAEGRVEQAEAAVAERNKELVERIKSGETTGDRALDFSILRMEGFDPKVADLYRGLDAQAKAHSGEPALVVFREIKYAGHSFTYGLTDPYAVESYGLGILTSGGLRFDQNGFAWYFPTETFSMLGERTRTTKNGAVIVHEPLQSDLGASLYTPLEGAIDRPVSELVDKERTDSRHGFTIFKDRPILEIGIGEHDVQRLVDDTDTGPSERQYAQMLDALLQLPIAPENRERRG